MDKADLWAGLTISFVTFQKNCFLKQVYVYSGVWHLSAAARGRSMNISWLRGEKKSAQQFPDQLKGHRGSGWS